MDKIRFIDTYGSKRLGVQLNCKYCDKLFITRLLKNKPKHTCCSPECSNKYKAKPAQKLICAWCNKNFERKTQFLRSSKSGLYFCTRKCKDEAQKIGGIEEIMPDHYGSGNGRYGYRKLFTDEELICNRCGYKEFNISVQIHHIDLNRENNDKSNLIPLCSNCHDALHGGFWKL